MVIDSHAHVTAPEALYVYKAGILSHRGGHGRGSVGATDEDILKALNAPVFGGSSHLQQLKEAGTDLQLISPRPYQLMNSEAPKLVQWFTEECNDIIARQAKLLPQTFRGVCALPLTPGVSPKAVAAVPGKMRQRTGVRRLPDQSRSGRVQRRGDSSAGRPLLVPAVRETGGAGRLRTHSFDGVQERAVELLAALHQ